MVRTLILTENIENELPFYEQLRRLNHEAFLSKDLLAQWIENNVQTSWEDIFNVVIISETIPQKEAAEISQFIKNKNQSCLLKTNEELSVEEEKEWHRKGIDYCFSTYAAFSEIREMMDKFKHEDPDNSYEQSEPTLFKEFFVRLTPKEEAIFSFLIDAKKRTVERQDVCKAIWGEVTNSTLSQLSLKIKQINQKIKNTLDIDNAIITVWSQGYRLNENFFESYFERRKEG